MHSGTILADLDLPREDFDNVVIDYNKDYGELTLSLFNDGHYQCEVCLDFVNKTICEDFTKDELGYTFKMGDNPLEEHKTKLLLIQEVCEILDERIEVRLYKNKNGDKPDERVQVLNEINSCKNIEKKIKFSENKLYTNGLEDFLESLELTQYYIETGEDNNRNSPHWRDQYWIIHKDYC